MKKQRLKEIIKEEIRKIFEEDGVDPIKVAFANTYSQDLITKL